MLDKKKEKQSLPEAPASVTARVVSDQGFHLLFTLRDTSVSGLISKFDEFQKHVLARGWKPESFDRTQAVRGSEEPSGSRRDKFGGEHGRISRGAQDRVFAHQTTPKQEKKEVKSSLAVCEVCGAVATRKSGYRKDGSRWEGVFCSTGEESHKVWLQ